LSYLAKIRNSLTSFSLAIAFSTVNWSAFLWLKWNFRFLSTIRAYSFIHSSFEFCHIPSQRNELKSFHKSEFKLSKNSPDRTPNIHFLYLNIRYAGFINLSFFCLQDKSDFYYTLYSANSPLDIPLFHLLAVL